MSLKNRFQIFLILACSLLSSSHTYSQSNSPTSLLLSYSNDSFLVERYLPIIREAYSAIGVNLEFVNVPIERGLQGISSGTFDGDVARLEFVQDHIENVTLVPPLLEEVSVKLFCRAERPCDASILSDTNTVIAVPIASPALPALFAMHSFRAQNVNGLKQIEDMFTLGRFDFFIWVESRYRPQPFLQNFSGNTVFIKKVGMYHVLNKKHAHLIPALSAQLENALNKLEK